MTRPILLILAVAMTAALLARSAAPGAHACSPEENPPHPLDAYDVVLRGRVTGWERFEAGAPLDFGGIPIRLTVEVYEVYKGADDSTVALINVWSLKPGAQEDWGIVGPCGPAGFFSDPTGDYVVVGLHQGGPEFGLPEAYTGRWIEGERFFVGGQPEGKDYEAALARLDRPTEGEAPIAPRGESPSAPAEDGTPMLPVILSALALLVIVAFASLVVWRRRTAP